MMTNSPFETTAPFATIDELKQGKIHEVNQYRLTWDNFLLVTHYGERQSFVLLTNGLRLIINQPLRQVLRTFSADNHCYTRCTVPYYELLGEQKPIKAYVAGLNILVPSMGTQNAEVVYYISKRLKEHFYSTTEQGMSLTFETETPQQRINIIVPAYENKFDKILNLADTISQMQLSEVREKCRRYGIEMPSDCFGNQYYEQAALTQTAWEIKRQIYGYVFNTFHEALYGERLGKKEMNRLMEMLFDTWR